jgi:hypothetical protein
MAERVVAVHQPNYVPWPGYFHKLARADVFVYLDSVQYPRGRSFAARNRIKTPNGVTYLTVPISVPHGREGKVSYLEVQFADEAWRDTHLRTIEQNYRKAPHFDEVFPLYRDGLERAGTFVDLTIGLVEAFASYLGIETERLRLSELGTASGGKEQLVLDVCRVSLPRASAALGGVRAGPVYPRCALQLRSGEPRLRHRPLTARRAVAYGLGRARWLIDN